MYVCMYLVSWIIGASLSEPHTSVASCLYVYVLYVRKAIYRKFTNGYRGEVHFKFAHVLKL